MKKWIKQLIFKWIERINNSIDDTPIEIYDNILKQCVTTIPDECKGVDSEIGTESKQEAID